MPSCARGVGLPSLITAPVLVRIVYSNPAGSASHRSPVFSAATASMGP